MKNNNTKYLLELSGQQYEMLEEAAEIMALDRLYVSSLEQTIEYLSERYIHEEGPKYEFDFLEDLR